MSNPKSLAPWVCLLSICAAGCDLFNTSDDEQVAGRGAAAFDPYVGQTSGAVKLGLQQYNGCAVGANGTPFGKGSANIPYPEECESFLAPVGAESIPAASLAPMQILSGTTYFLDKLSLVQIAEDLHTDLNNVEPVAAWMRTQSRFAGLNWSGLGVQSEDWRYDSLPPGFPADYPRTASSEVMFGNAAWQLDRSQTFTVEILDADGELRGEPVVYRRDEFLGEGARGGHTRLSWRAAGLETPRSQNDRRPAATVTNPEYPQAVVNTQTTVRIEFVGLTSPLEQSKRIRVPSGLGGDGALRVTWSALPNQPLYFPVTFIDPTQRPADCYEKGTEARVPCSFGLAPEVGFSVPANGEFFAPGETVEFTVSYRDEDGNYLHPATHLPSLNDFMRGTSNGLQYYLEPQESRMREVSGAMIINVAGPRHEMKPYYELGDRPYFSTQGTLELPSSLPAQGIANGGGEFLFPTRYRVPLPEDVKPGTYSLTVQASRAWMGERFAKQRTFTFQVGTAQATEYRNKIGNCQICHRGTVSLDNVLHGESVDNVENCRSCHDVTFGKSIAKSVHEVHMPSDSYEMDKADCTVCHLTRDSAVRPSMNGCVSCHQGLHGNTYFDLQFASFTSSLSEFSNCAQACHVKSVPSGHILPER